MKHEKNTEKKCLRYYKNIDKRTKILKIKN